ncbi:MAG: hypothetical protein JXR56_01715 [Candidatus Cloacimonetes bacterium]|nr:hypothetical protein [Candidatus Cloacimonadota bacterium]
MKKIIIIIIIILIPICLQLLAKEPTKWINLRYLNYTSDGEERFGFRNTYLGFYDLKYNLASEIGIDFLLGEKAYPDNYNNIGNRLSSNLVWSLNKTYLQAGFNSNYYGFKRAYPTHIDGLFYPDVEPVLKNNLTFMAKQTVWNFDLEGSLRYRNLNYEYGDPVSSEQENDLFSDLKINYRFYSDFSVFGTLYYKDDLANIKSSEIPPDYPISDPESYYNELAVGGGLSWKHRIGLNHGIKAQTQYLYREGDTLPDYLQNYFLTDIRYTFTLTPSLNGFLGYINRSCYAQAKDVTTAKDGEGDEGKFYRIANVVRAQLKYQLNLLDERAYCCAGAKYNPENKTDRYFVEVSYPVISRLTIKAGDAFSPEYYNDIYCGIEFMPRRLHTLFLENRYTIVRNDITALADYNLLTVGARFFF